MAVGQYKVLNLAAMAFILQTAQELNFQGIGQPCDDSFILPAAHVAGSH